MRVAVMVVVLVAAVLGQEAVLPVVNTEEGRISGLKEHSLNGAAFYAYRSIPFAQPPVGDLRFKAPVASSRWDGVRDGSSEPPLCLQPTFMTMLTKTKEVHGSEDCLYLSVFTPSEPGSGRRDLPVMVFIHGGAFFCGSASGSGPNALLNHDMILVVMQYRLGVLGFLSTEDDTIPGNFGLLDQVLALQWVQRNIHHFGGDPQKVTIFGESAGAASVSYHLLSSKSRGLYSRAIMQSGSALNPWAHSKSRRDLALHAGRTVGCGELEDSHGLLGCLQRADADKLASVVLDFLVFHRFPLVNLGPRVDGDFLVEEPAKTLKEGRQNNVPIISGVTTDEAAMFSIEMTENESVLASLNEKLSEASVAILEIGAHEDNPVDLANKIFQHYLGGVNPGVDYTEQFNQMMSDRLFKVGVHHTSRLHSQVATTYTYEFNHRGQFSLLNVLPWLSTENKHWVSHADDLLYLFSGGGVWTALNFSIPDDLHVRDLFTQLWFNFAATGSPTPDDSLGFTWSPTTPSAPYHLNLNSKPSMVPDSHSEMMEFWTSLPTKENLILYPEREVTPKMEEKETREEL
ncbi:juvenile hormone esterase [Cherax quadricarinatus]